MLSIIGSICLAAIAFTSDGAGASADTRIRGLTPAVKSLLAIGVRRSPTFARLIRELEASDVVVYVEATAYLPPGLHGRLTFVASVGGVRYLRAEIPARGGFDWRIAIAGHELQHALEVAAHRDVRSSGDLGLLYQRIGIQVSVKDRYDTIAAQRIGRRVRAELG